ncbi:MAG: hypothetical protein Q7R93_02040, partial [bacterium]|nr:hypothetical protein [bacterium]
ENMKQVASLRREIAPHISFLKKQVEKVEKTKQLKEELRGLYVDYLKREHVFITFSKQQIAKEEHAPKSELADLTIKLATSKKILEETHGKDAKTQAVIAVEERLNSLRKSREEASRELGRLEGEIAGAERLSKLKSADESALVIPFAEVEGIAKQISSVVDEAEEEKDASVLLHTIGRIREFLYALLEKHRSRKNLGVEDFEKEIVALTAKKKELEKKIGEIHTDEKEAQRQEHSLRTEIDKAKDSSRDAEKEVFRIMARQNELYGTLNALRLRLADIEHAEGDFKRELTEGVLLVGREILEYEKDGHHHASGLHDGAHPEDRSVQEERRRKVEKLKIRIEDAGGGSGAEVLKEYEEATERDQFLAREIADLEKSAETLRGLIVELEQKLDEEFRGGIEKINKEFQNYFSLMFGGGTARLAVAKPEKKARREVDDLLDGGEAAAMSVAEDTEQQAGIDIEVNLPRKKVKALMMLSGGERALTSIALLFAMSQVKPPPFIILDETDAALDEANSKKYGDMVENLSKHSQLILITHNRETMSRAGVIYGVTMDKSGVSKLLSIAFDEAVAVAK